MLSQMMLRFRLLTILAWVLAAPLAACEDNDSTAEKVGEAVEEAGDEAGDAVEDAGDAVEDAAQ